jgi:hypothetical protein
MESLIRRHSFTAAARAGAARAAEVCAAGDGAHATSGLPMAVGLFNDSGDDPRVAALASSQAHRRLLRLAGAEVRHGYFRRDWRELGAGPLDDGIAAALASPELRRVFAEVDAVVVIGDTLRDQPHAHLLVILAAAQHLDLPTYLVNASLGAVDVAHAVLAGLTDCTVRDTASARLLQRIGVAHRLVPDAIFSAQFAERAVRDFSGHLVVTDCHPSRRAEFTPALAAVRARWPGMVADYPIDATGSAGHWAFSVADLATASAVLTGGYDGACLALKAGVPFVVLGADPMAAAMLDLVVGYPAAAADASRPLVERLAAAVAARAWFAEVAAHWHGRSPVETFARLRPGLAAAGRDDTWLGSIDGVVEAVRAVTPPGGSVLHAGAGQGRTVEALAQIGLRPWGADVARRLDRPDRNRYSRATPLALPFADHVFSTVVVSADWIEHLEPDDLEAAVAELARVAEDAILIEVSGRPLRVHRAFEDRCSPDWWKHELATLGLRPHDGPLGGAEQNGPTGGTLVAMSAPAHLCSSCRRAHGGPDQFEPIHPGVLAAAAAPRRSPRVSDPA